MPEIEVPRRYRAPTGGAAKIPVEGDTVRACIEDAEARYPGFGELVLDEKGELRRFVKLFVNGDELARDALDVPISEADTIAVLHAAPGQQRRGPGREHRLETPARAEKHRARQIQPQQHRPLALFAVNLGVGAPAARGNAPVDSANIVAGLVLPHLVELHPASAEYALVVPGEQIVDRSVGDDLDSLHLLEYLGNRLVGRHRRNLGKASDGNG